MLIESRAMDERASRLDSGLRWLNALPAAEAEEALIRCCGSRRFASSLAALRPFGSFEELQSAARDVWWNKVDITGWLEAFSAHPRIGDVASLKRKFSTQQWSQGEQATAMQSCDDAFFKDMAECNERYEQRYGHIFIICAQGKPAPEILAALKERMSNQPIYEVQIAAKEQESITRLRLEKLLLDAAPAAAGPGAPTPAASSAVTPATVTPATVTPATVTPATVTPATVTPATVTPAAVTPATSTKPRSISTHVLDVAKGKPAAGIRVVLEKRTEAGGNVALERRGVEAVGDAAERGTEQTGRRDGGGAVGVEWERVGEGVTNSDGRTSALLDESRQEGGGGRGEGVRAGVKAGVYRLTFVTGEYFDRVHGAGGSGGEHGDIAGGGGGFFPRVSIEFRVLPCQQGEHFHVPLLLSPFSYSTYRGS